MNILVIDDDPATTDLMQMLLKPLGAKVFIANSGIEGINLIPASNPDLITLDLTMPNMDGWEVCKKIRTFADTPILILSALDSPSLIARALDAGADDFVTKPISSAMLCTRINSLLRRSNPRHSFDQISLNPLA